MNRDAGLRCPYCAMDVKAGATVCPNCQGKIAPPSQPGAGEAVPALATAPPKKSGKPVLFIALGAMAAVVAVVFFIVQSEQNAGPPVPELHFFGTLSSTVGATSIVGGTPCTVDVTPPDEAGDFNCRVRVTCGDQIIYGSGRYGYVDCQTYDGGNGSIFIEAHDPGITTEDGDPRIDLSTERRQIVVSDGQGGAAWSVTIVFSNDG